VKSVYYIARTSHLWPAIANRRPGKALNGLPRRMRRTVGYRSIRREVSCCMQVTAEEGHKHRDIAPPITKCDNCLGQCGHWARAWLPHEYKHQ